MLGPTVCTERERERNRVNERAIERERQCPMSTSRQIHREYTLS